MTEQRHDPIAIVGVSALFPGSVDKTGFWRDILEGRDLLTEIPESHWLIDDYYDPDPTKPDKTYAKRGAFLPDVDFDPVEWGIPPSIVPQTDTTQLLGLIVAKQVLDDALDGQFSSMDRERVSCILGVTSGQELMGSMVSRLQRPVWTKALREAGLPESQVQSVCDRISTNYTKWEEANFPGLLGNVVAGRIANRLDIGGTNCVTDAACASTFSALSMAVNELTVGQSDLVIAGGCDTMNDIFMYMCFSKTPALSASGDCRPFSDKADGTMLGEGLGMVALMRLSEAEKRGMRIYAVIRGVGSSSDGRAKSVYAPVPQGQAKAIRRAYQVAGYGPETVELIEAHGTGTKAGDAAEFEGLRIVFDESGRKDRQWCALGSVKSQIGHTKSAAGAAGLIKAVLALHHKVLPPTLKVDKPNPKLELDKSPFHLSTKARPWVRGADHPRRAGVSSFGFGGSNFHIAVEEYVGPAEPAWRTRATRTELVLVSGDSADQVASKCRELAREVEEAEKRNKHGMLAFVARTTQEAFVPRTGARVAVVAANEAELVAKLRKAAELALAGKAQSTSDGIAFEEGAHEGKVAFLYPGQGSQYVGMGDSIAMHLEEARAAWDLAASLPLGDARLSEVVFPPTAFDAESDKALSKRLTRTEWAQPGIGAASLALTRVMDAVGLYPAAVAGHSFGEVMALHAAGAISAADALRIARRRGELMAEAARTTQGSMVAVVADAKSVREKLASWGLPVVVANHNAPDQVVLSGPTDAIVEVEKRLTAEKLTCKRLDVATAFHSPVVSAASAPFAASLADIAVSAPRIDVYANATAAAYPADPAGVRATLGAQLGEPVRFVEQIEAMYAAGVRTFVEVGPGSVLTGLVGKILGSRPHRAIALDRKGGDGMTALFIALGRLAVAGLPLSLGKLWERFAPPVDPRSSKTPKLTLKLNGANYGKPYPPPGGKAALPKPNPEKPPETVRVVEKIVEKIVEKPVPVPVATPAQSQSLAQMPSQPMTQHNDGRSGSAQLAWIHAYQESQRQTAEAHAAFQRAMADSHAAFLRAAEASFFGLAAMVNPGVGAPAYAVAPALPQMPQMPQQPAFAPPVAVAQPVAVAPAYVPPPVAAPQPVVSAPVVSAPVVAAPVVSAPAPAASVDLMAVMLEVVAQKTGYPSEMIGMEMELEADLGIDSIKRVEILSAVRERAPGLPDLDPAALGQLRTVGQIVDHLKAHLPASATPSAPAASAPRAAAPAASAGVDLMAVMLEVVAQKTGYPSEMIGMEMELEADLGIDSIKRVEILSAVRERAPGLPDLDPAALGQLRTVGQIVDHLKAHLPGSSAPANTAPAAQAPAASSASANGIDLMAVMLDVVAQKTGYPSEMIGMEMELEADLGIDSIKRVEILSAVRERAPGLPDLDPAALGQLRTVGQIVDHLEAHLPGSVAAGTERAAAAALSGAATAAGESHSPAATHTHAGPKTRWTLRAVPRAASGLMTPGLLGAKRIGITDDESGLAPALAQALSDRGVSAEVVGRDVSECDALVFLGGTAPLSTEDAALAICRDAFLAAKGMATKLTTDGGAFITVQDTGGDFGLSGGFSGDPRRALLGGLAGLAKTAAQEWPKAHVRAIDLELGSRAPEDVAAALADELVAGGPELEIGLRANGSRWTLVSEPHAIGPSSPVLSAGDVVVASGGARGVTAATLIALARETKCRLVLLGRSAIDEDPEAVRGVEGDAALKKALLEDAKRRGAPIAPAELGKRVDRIVASREVRATIDAIRGVGTDVRYLAVDVQDAAGVARALDAIRSEWGPIRGLVHGAGVLADRFIADKTVEQYQRVVDTKVEGLRALLTATGQDPLKVIALFSSVAARTGNQGQCDYAMANEILNKVAQREAARRPGCVVKSLGWGPWEGGMVTPALKARFEKLGVPLIALAAGARMLVDELASGSGPEIELVLGGEPKPEALLHDPMAPSVRALETRIAKSTHPEMASHVVKGAPVMPAVFALELFSRAAKALRPELEVVAIRDLAVLKGIRLGGYESTGDRLIVKAERASAGATTLAMTLESPSGARHYAAKVELGAALSPATTGAPTLGDLAPWNDRVYDGFVLFHGPMFHAILEVEGENDKGLSGTLVGWRELGWDDRGWATDPALLDGGLQLAVLWAKHALRGASLPTAIGAYVSHSHDPLGPLTCVVRGAAHGKDKASFDIAFVDATGAVACELRGVDVHVLPGSREELARTIDA